MNPKRCVFANCTVSGEPIVAMKIGMAEINLSESLRVRGRIAPTSTDEIIAGRLPPEILTELLNSPDGITPLEDGASFRACVLAPQKIIMVGLNHRRYFQETKKSYSGHADVVRKIQQCACGSR